MGASQPPSPRANLATSRSLAHAACRLPQYAPFRGSWVSRVRVDNEPQQCGRALAALASGSEGFVTPTGISWGLSILPTCLHAGQLLFDKNSTSLRPGRQAGTTHPAGIRYTYSSTYLEDNYEQPGGHINQPLPDLERPSRENDPRRGLPGRGLHTI